VRLEDAIAAVEARQCGFDEVAGVWVKHRVSSGACNSCDRGLWSLLDMYAINVGVSSVG
jgi:hypothetical protein